ncbi:MAG: lipid-A-disaccharide synthase [Rhodobacteraceae bacterium]|nr:lipid-A-disaccharide synthase [Paracoccaceae bacterium]
MSEDPIRIGLVVGEESGDFLGSSLMASLKVRLPGVVFVGVGGERMEQEGLSSLFDIADTSVMGISAVLARLPLMVKRVYQTVDALVAANPDLIVIIDSPDFTHSVAKRVRKRAPHIRIVGYVSPSVWVWRPGRARKMSAYVDHLLALLPFEPDVHKRLGGPVTHYVGHPLIERLDQLRPSPGERTPLSDPNRVLVVLPGSRGSEIDRLLEVFGETVAKVSAQYPDLEVLLPTVPHLAERIEAGVKAWAVKPTLVYGEDGKHAAFRRAHAALAASGTVTLQLAISGIPMIVAYKVDWIVWLLKHVNRVFKFIDLRAFSLPNIILGRKVLPEYLDGQVTADKLAPALLELLHDSEARRAQVEAFAELDREMALPEGKSQSEAAADIVVGMLGVKHP